MPQLFLFICALLISQAAFGFSGAAPFDTGASVNTMELLDDTTPIKVGDKLSYMVAEDREAANIVLVDESGKIDVPLIGKIEASGLTPRELAQKISDALEVDYYYQATVHVSEYKDLSNRGQIFLLGQVARQGAMTIPPGEVLTVSKAILRAGGFTQQADPTRVSLIRQSGPGDKEVKTEINVARILETGRLEDDLIVQPDDFIFVAQAGDSSGEYTVTGAVRGPGIYPLPMGTQITLSQAILKAGGFTEFASESSVKIIRYDENGERKEFQVDVGEILEDGLRDNDILLQPDDRVIVPEAWVKF
ncbi:polysaccharide export protein [Ruficoccus amylovorans]|uniref:Polysaccharide export protein n=1 Tax=Ruficoccus amylovorans TaxID=1804625 RepID=A0A842HC80_9BACT|nr:polysaccharide biosynthesis/export family protein [Ruficoccus amylovorans]MBC2594073.1 polysaccharide export protein [Ruficoccus amylovorans]